MGTNDSTFVQPQSMHEAKYREVELLEAIRSISHQLKLFWEGRLLKPHAQWETRALLSRQAHEAELAAVRAWIKHHPDAPLNQTRLFNCLLTSRRIFWDMKERGVALTLSELAWFEELERSYPLPRPRQSSAARTDSSVWKADELTIARSCRDRSSIEMTAEVGLQIFCETREAADLIALEENTQRAKVVSDDVGRARTAQALVKALAMLGMGELAEVALKLIPSTEEAARCKALIEMGHELKEVKYLERARAQLLTLPLEVVISVYCALYQASGERSDLDQAREKLQHLYESHEFDDDRLSDLSHLVVTMNVKHGLFAHARSLSGQITNTSTKCKALAHIAKHTGDVEDLYRLVEFMQAEAVELSPKLVREIVSTNVAYKRLAVARGIGESLHGAMRCIAYSVLANESPDVDKKKLLRWAEEALCDTRKTDPAIDLAQLELARALTKEGRYEEARAIARQMRSPKHLAEICLMIYSARKGRPS